MYTIKWITPRIRFVETIDDFDNAFYDIDYGVWDAKERHFKQIRKALKDLYVPKRMIREYYTEYPEPGVEERHFISYLFGEEEKLSKRIVHQFLHNFMDIWNWRPRLIELVLRDMDEFLNEDERFRREFDRWYTNRLHGPYRHPHFYRDYLINKIPMGKEGAWREPISLLNQ